MISTKKLIIYQISLLFLFFAVLILGFKFSSTLMANVDAETSQEPQYLFDLPKDSVIGKWLDASVSEAGNLYLLQTFSYHRLDVYLSDGTLADTWVTPGGPDFLNRTNSAIQVDKVGNILVADEKYRELYKLDPNGNLIDSFTINRPVDFPYSDISGKFADIAVDSANNYYCLDAYNYRIKKYNSDGDYLNDWLLSDGYGGRLTSIYVNDLNDIDSNNDIVNVSVSDENRIERTNVNGVFQNNLNLPTLPSSPQDISIVTDATNNTYVTSWNYYHVFKYNSSDALVDQFQIGNSTGKITMDNEGNLVIPSESKRLVVYTSSGDVVKIIGPKIMNPSFITLRDTAEVFLTGTDEADYSNILRKYYPGEEEYDFEFPYGEEIGQLKTPGGLTVDNTERFIVGDGYMHRVNIYSKDLNYLSSFGSNGSGDGQFGRFIGGIDVDDENNIWVEDMENQRVQKFNSEGDFIMKFGSGGSGDGQFNINTGNYGDLLYYNNYLYVADANNYRIQKFTLNGEFVSKFGSRGSEEGQFEYSPIGIEVNPLGQLVIITTKNVNLFDTEGNFLGRWGKRGYDKGDFLMASGLAIDKYYNMYISDAHKNTVQVFGYPSSVVSDKSGVEIDPLQVIPLSKGGAAFTFDLVLTSPPISDVTVNFTQGAGTASIFDKLFGKAYAAASQLELSPSSLVFTTHNWNTPQTVTVRGVGEGDNVELTAVSSSTTAYYSGTILGTLTFRVAGLATTGNNALIGITSGMFLSSGFVLILKRRINFK